MYLDIYKVTLCIPEDYEAKQDTEFLANTEDPEFEFDESGLQLASKEGID